MRLEAMVIPVLLLGALPVQAGADLGEDLRLSGYAQVQYEAHDDSVSRLDEDGEPLNHDRFLVRRGRLKVSWEGSRFAHLGLEVDASSSGVSLKEAEAMLLFPFPGLHVDVALGLFKVPFGFATPQSRQDDLFLEPPFVTRTFFPGERDLGLRLRVASGIFNAVMAVVNGNPIGEELFPGRDPNANKDLVARFGIDLEWLDAGLSAQVGKELVPGAREVPATTTWVDLDGDDAPDETEVTTTSAVPATPDDNVGRNRLGVDVELVLLGRFGRLDLLGEIALAHREGVNGGAGLDQVAWTFAFAHHLLPFLGIAIRVDGLDPDTDTGDDERFVVENALLLYPVAAMRLTLAYDLVADATAQARSREGTFVSENVVTIRAQMRF